MTAQQRQSPFKGKVAENMQESGTGGKNYLDVPGSIPFFRPKRDEQDTVYLDFLPYTVKKKSHPDRNDRKERARPGDWWWKHAFGLHRNIGANKSIVVCPRTEGKQCEACNERSRKFEASGGKATKETDSLRPSQRVLYIVVPRNHPDYEEKPHLFEIAWKNFGELLRMEMKRDPEKEVFPDPDEGMLLEVSFAPEQIEANSPKYAKAFRIDFLTREKPVTEELLNAAPNLDDVVIVPSADEMYKTYWAEPDEGEEEQETPFKDAPNAAPSTVGQDEATAEVQNQQAQEQATNQEPAQDTKSDKEQKREQRRKRTKGSAEETKNPCPFGLRFGEDWDKEEYRKENCDKCPQETWDACADEHDKLYGQQ